MVWSSTPSTARVKARWGRFPSLTERITTSMGFIASPSHGLQLPERVSRLEGAAQPPEPSMLSPAALHNGHFAPAAPSECMWAMWDTGKMVSMATRTSEMPVRKFALGENILLQLTLQRRDRGGLQQHPTNGGVKISLVILVQQCSVCSLPGLAVAFVPCSDKATPSHHLQLLFFSKKAKVATLGSNVLFWPPHPSGPEWDRRGPGVKLSLFPPWSWPALQMLATGCCASISLREADGSPAAGR